MSSSASYSAAQHSNGEEQGGCGSGAYQSLANFTWATFSNHSWSMTAEQRTAIMGLGRQLVDGFNAQQCSNVLMGLLRQRAFEGPGTVQAFLEAGTVALLVDHFCTQLSSARAQACQDVLLRCGTGSTVGHKPRGQHSPPVLRASLPVLC